MEPIQDLRSRSVLLAGDRPGAAAGAAVLSTVLFEALSRFASVDVLSHVPSLLPSFRHETETSSRGAFIVGTQPITVHGEALAGGWLNRRRLRAWSCAWAATSRYAGALFASGIPYAVWEATTARDELDTISVQSVRRNGNGSGIGTAIHRILSPIDERLERATYRSAVRLLAMSEYSRALISNRHHLPMDSIEVLLSPPSLAFLEALASRTATSPFALPTHSPRLLFVGRVTDPRKNAQLLLDTFRLVRQAIPGATLTIVGRVTSQWRRLSGVDDPASGIVLTGEIDVPSLANAYITHDVLLVPSRQEGYGLVVAEALHAGLPVVSTRCGGPEGIIRDSGGGTLVEHASRDFASAVVGIVSNEDRWCAMARHGYEYARSVLSFDRFVARVSEITNAMAQFRAPDREYGVHQGVP